eukprot:gene17923-19704_t
MDSSYNPESPLYNPESPLSLNSEYDASFSQEGDSTIADMEVSAKKVIAMDIQTHSAETYLHEEKPNKSSTFTNAAFVPASRIDPKHSNSDGLKGRPLLNSGILSDSKQHGTTERKRKFDHDSSECHNHEGRNNHKRKVKDSLSAETGETAHHNIGKLQKKLHDTSSKKHSSIMEEHAKEDNNTKNKEREYHKSLADKDKREVKHASMKQHENRKVCCPKVQSQDRHHSSSIADAHSKKRKKHRHAEKAKREKSEDEDGIKKHSKKRKKGSKDVSEHHRHHGRHKKKKSHHRRHHSTEAKNLNSNSDHYTKKDKIKLKHGKHHRKKSRSKSSDNYSNSNKLNLKAEVEQKIEVPNDIKAADDQKNVKNEHSANNHSSGQNSDSELPVISVKSPYEKSNFIATEELKSEGLTEAKNFDVKLNSRCLGTDNIIPTEDDSYSEFERLSDMEREIEQEKRLLQIESQSDFSEQNSIVQKSDETNPLMIPSLTNKDTSSQQDIFGEIIQPNKDPAMQSEIISTVQDNNNKFSLNKENNKTENEQQIFSSNQAFKVESVSIRVHNNDENGQENGDTNEDDQLKLLPRKSKDDLFDDIFVQEDVPAIESDGFAKVLGNVDSSDTSPKLTPPLRSRNVVTSNKRDQSMKSIEGSQLLHEDESQTVNCEQKFNSILSKSIQGLPISSIPGLDIKEGSEISAISGDVTYAPCKDKDKKKTKNAKIPLLCDIDSSPDKTQIKTLPTKSLDSQEAESFKKPHTPSEEFLEDVDRSQFESYFHVDNGSNDSPYNPEDQSLPELDISPHGKNLIQQEAVKETVQLRLKDPFSGFDNPTWEKIIKAKSKHEAVRQRRKTEEAKNISRDHKRKQESSNRKNKSHAMVDYLVRQSRVEEECKDILKQYYKSKDITKEEYKTIMRKAVPQVTMSNSPIIPEKIRSLIKKFVAKCKGQRLLELKQTGREKSGNHPTTFSQGLTLPGEKRFRYLNPDLPMPPV